MSVTGIAGIGKSRLAWEFYKYFDGLAETRLLAPRPLPGLRRGRHVLGAGRHGADALPDRRGRGAGEPRSRSCARRSRSTFSTPTSGGSWSRGWRSCSGSASTRRATGRISSRPGGCSSSGWRTTYPTVLVVRGHAVGGRGLLDFVEYLLEWSRSHPLYVVTLARPELAERRPTWGAGHRNFTSLYLEPLADGGDGGAPRRARARGCRPSCATRSWRARRAFRCTRSRRCGCCSTAACSSRKARRTGPSARSRRSRCRRRCTR